MSGGKVRRYTRERMPRNPGYWKVVDNQTDPVTDAKTTVASFLSPERAKALVQELNHTTPKEEPVTLTTIPIETEDDTPIFKDLLAEFSDFDVQEALSREPWSFEAANARVEPEVQKALAHPSKRVRGKDGKFVKAD